MGGLSSQKKTHSIAAPRLLLIRAANNGQQVAGHDDRPNIF